MIGEGLFAKFESRPARCRMVVACLFVMALSACLTPPFDARPDLVRTWEEAWVYLPAAEDGEAPVAAKIESVGGKAAARIARFQERGPKPPVVLYLHGCTGLGNIVFFEALAQAGYVVIAPDSMARGFRPLQCDPKTKTGGHNLFVYDFRLAEISYALERMRELSWIDHDNQYLAGTSEGGVAVALYRGGEFRARVIAQWTWPGRSDRASSCRTLHYACSRHRARRRSVVWAGTNGRPTRSLRRVHGGTLDFTLDRSSVRGRPQYFRRPGQRYDNR